MFISEIWQFDWLIEIEIGDVTPSGGLAAHGEVGKAALNSMKVVYQNSGGFTSHVVQKVSSTASVVTRQPVAAIQQQQQRQQQQQQQQRHYGNQDNYNSDNDLPIKKVNCIIQFLNNSVKSIIIQS